MSDPGPILDWRLLRRVLLVGAILVLVALLSLLIWCGPAPAPRPTPVATLSPLPEPTHIAPSIRPTPTRAPATPPMFTPPGEGEGKG